jgi:hypothetical protein
MLAVDLAEVRNVEGVLVARLTKLMVDGLDALVKGLTNQLLGIYDAILDGMNLRLHKGHLFHPDMMVGLNMAVEGSRCHYHIPGISGGDNFEMKKWWATKEKRELPTALCKADGGSVFSWRQSTGKFI